MVDTIQPVGVATIEALLRAAASAHGEYEAAELDGKYDTEWPRWYATHMARSLNVQGLTITKEGQNNGTA